MMTVCLLMDPFAALGWLILMFVILCAAALPLLVVSLALFSARNGDLKNVQNKMQEAQQTLPVCAEVTSVTPFNRNCHAELRLLTSTALPEVLDIDFPEVLQPGQTVRLRLFPKHSPPTLMTLEDFTAYCIALEKQEARLKKRLTIAAVFAVLAGILTLGLIVGLIYVWNAPKRQLNL